MTAVPGHAACAGGGGAQAGPSRLFRLLFCRGCALHQLLELVFRRVLSHFASPHIGRGALAFSLIFASVLCFAASALVAFDLNPHALRSSNRGSTHSVTI